MAAAMDPHADRLLHTLHGGYGRGRRNPLVRLEREAILCEEGTRSLLLHGAAIELRGDGGWRGRRGFAVRSSGTMMQSAGRTTMPGRARRLGTQGYVRRGRVLGLDLVFNGRGQGRRRGCGRGALGRLFSLEDAAHALYIFAQAHAAVSEWQLRGPGRSWGGHGGGQSRAAQRSLAVVLAAGELLCTGGERRSRPAPSGPLRWNRARTLRTSAANHDSAARWSRLRRRHAASRPCSVAAPASARAPGPRARAASQLRASSFPLCLPRRPALPHYPANQRHRTLY